MRGKILVLALLAIVLPLAGVSCGGGGGGGLSVEDLAGTWFGVMVDSAFEPHTYQFTMGSSGNMSDFYLDEISFPAFTGTAFQESGRIFNFLMSNGTEGGFITDESGTHLAFLSEEFSRGVLEKGATGLPPVFSALDYQGTWNGYSIWLDADLEVANEGPTTITITGGDVIGTGLTGAFAGSIVDFIDADYGVVWGANGSATTYFELALSPDRTFMATIACNALPLPIEITDCEFGAYTEE